ncbi:MAG: type I secretion system permease/ATPase [Chitinophagaceae bacterium]|nr:type I secretion system permease/ATPase [Rubrivivax sp.]
MSASPRAAPAQPPANPELRAAFASPRRLYMQAARQSLVIGALMLVPSWFMFEVYGRVLNSRNETTLLWLLLVAVGTYVALELMEVVRLRVLYRAAQIVEQRLRRRVFDAAFTAMLRRLPGASTQVVADVRVATDFIYSQAVTALLDLPASLLCLLLLYLMSPWLVLLALAAAALQAAIGAYQERNSSRPYGEANVAAAEAQLRAAGTLRNAQVIQSMGMETAMHKRWTESQRRFIVGLGNASDKAGSASAASKLVVSVQGSLLLGLACWLGVNNELAGGAGMAIVASILGGRVLAPLAQLIGQWRAIGGARTAYSRVSALLHNVPPEDAGMELPPPKGVLVAESITVVPPGSQAPVLKNVTFGALPGELLTVIGPSAAGKTSLARALIGVWPSQGGKVRLDGADVFAWHKSQLGPHMGYLSQGVELFDGSVAENIARFGKVDQDLVRQAADEVGITAMVEALPDGFDTQIGEDGAVLSGGQRQRLGLARAIYGSPRVVVLDEPNSSLDEAGEKALIEMIGRLKAKGTTVIAITHRSTLLAAADKLLLLVEGAVASFGPRDDVLAALKKANEQVAAKPPVRPLAPATASAAAAP